MIDLSQKKNALKSRSIQGAIIVLLGWMATTFDLGLSEGDITRFVEALSDVFIAGGTIWTVFGRIGATQSLTWPWARD